MTMDNAVPGVIAALIVTVWFTDAHPVNHKFDITFQNFLDDHGYIGGAVAAMKGGNLLHAKGYGVNKVGEDVKDTSLFPTSSISKSITAVAVLKLVQEGKMRLNSRVFGREGLLHVLKPFKTASIDKRLDDITVNHLLHHTAGWDHTKEPLYDPILNPVYLKRGHNVPNITKIMDAPSPLSHYNTIRYVMSQKLDFTPGTKSVFSNFGYTVLGRIIEEVADTPYDDYIKTNILKPCGMWHTRIGRSNKISELDNMSSRLSKSEVKNEEISIYDVLNAEMIDSTLGWYSNVYDIMRFIRCIPLKHGHGLLNVHYVEQLLKKPEAGPVQHNENWYGAGFRANTRGVLWQDGDPHADDIILFHHEHHVHTNMPDTWVMFLYGRRVKHLKHTSHDLMHLIKPDPKENHFVHDLSDIQDNTGIHKLNLKYAVDEHHLDAYMNALKLENYNITWISGYMARHHTLFTVISERTQHSKLKAEDYIVQHGLTEKKLLSGKLKFEEEGYNMTFLQNYKSASHDSRHVFLAIFRKEGYDKQHHMKFGIHHFPQPYDKLLGLYMEKGYYPTVQSYIHHDDEAFISFMFIKRENKTKIRFKTYHELSIKQLDRVVQMNAKAGRKLTYMDVDIVYRKPKFSAIFTNENPSRWLFKTGLQNDDVTNLVLEKGKEGLLPKEITGYVDKDRQLKYAVYFEKKLP